MANLQSLKASITEMEHGRALLLVRSVRDSRRIPKVSLKSKSSKKKPSKIIDPFAIISNMTTAQKQKLKQELLGEM